MDKDFSICKYLLSKTENDEQMEARLKMVCVAMAKDVPEAITCGQHEFAD